jgi:hypothetical protein
MKEKRNKKKRTKNYTGTKVRAVMLYEGEKGNLNSLSSICSTSAGYYNKKQYPHNNKTMYRVTIPQRSLLSRGDS